MAVSLEKKKRVAFTLIMGLVTTGVISFTLIAWNIGFTDRFLEIWLKSWPVAYVIVIPVILFIAPPLQKVIDAYFDARN